MGPTRKSRSVNKRSSSVNEDSPSKDGDNSKRSNQRKRKLTNLLGPQWSKEELGRFYDAYRKHGKDWKKVASAVRNRSVEMVEALYTMNKAYLSLPEGTASVVGLIAMMTDYYSNLAGTDSEQESNEGAGSSRRPQKRARGKVSLNASKTSVGPLPLHSQTLGSSYGCLSLLKKRRSGGTRPRAVGKRTPRFPISYSYETVDGEKYFSSTRQGLKINAGGSDDEVAHEIALALTKASQRGGSPQVSQTPNRKTESILLSPTKNAEREDVEREMDRVKLVGSDTDEDLEGSMEADTGELSRCKINSRETSNVGKTPQRGRRYYGEMLDVDDIGDNHLDDIKEACSGTEEGQRLGAGKGKLDAKTKDIRASRSSPQGLRKHSKKILFGRDEDSAFNALQTLADLSLMMPTMANEDESMVHVKDEHDDHVDESGSFEVQPANHQGGDKHKLLGAKAKGSRVTARPEISPNTALKSGKGSGFNVSAVPEAKQEKVARKKQKARKTEVNLKSHVPEQEAEAKDVGKISMSKSRKSSQSASQKLIRTHEQSSSADPRKEGSDSSQSTVQVPLVNQVNLPTKVRSRRKLELKKPQLQKDLKFPDKIVDSQANQPVNPPPDGTLDLKEKLSNCLFNHHVRRWCIHEWFYSAIDYPWFAKREFVEYLHHVGLGHVPRLTRVEWGVIRSSLGKPRRFSEHFLKEEKEKLDQYRQSVREHYTELREGTREGLPTDLARPLFVGQRVIAIHPKTREIHDGSVLTVDRSRCRVQFDRPELGVEFVKDIECMPLNPLENVPTLLARHTDAVDKFIENFNELKMNGREYIKFPPGGNSENVDGLSQLSLSTYCIDNLLNQTKVASANVDVQARVALGEASTYQQVAYCHSSTWVHIHAKEADAQALADLKRALDKKEAVVSELKHMNDDLLEYQNGSDLSLKDSDPFKKQYAAVLLQLNEINEQVSYALRRLRQRNTYQGNLKFAGPRNVANYGDPASQTQDTGSQVNEIIESSRMKAQTMVDAALQAISSLNARESAIDKIEEAIDFVNDRLALEDSPLTIANKSIIKNELDSEARRIPSELITQCVATLLMIQKCTERQFPPADVAQILDSAAVGLRPCCSQNHSVYAEIQKCMGIIKNQILALVPT